MAMYLWWYVRTNCFGWHICAGTFVWLDKLQLVVLLDTLQIGQCISDANTLHQIWLEQRNIIQQPFFMRIAHYMVWFYHCLTPRQQPGSNLGDDTDDGDDDDDGDDHDDHDIIMKPTTGTQGPTLL